MSCFQKALALEPRAAQAWFFTGMVQLDLGDYKGALAAFDRARGDDSNRAMLAHLRGDALHNLGQLDDARTAAELQVEMQKQQNNLGARSRAQALQGQQPMAYDQQAIIAQADQVVQQMAALDPGSRQSQMHALQVEDLVMFSVVKERLQAQQTAANHQAITAARQGGDPAAAGADPAGGAGAPPPPAA